CGARTNVRNQHVGELDGAAVLPDMDHLPRGHHRAHRLGDTVVSACGTAQLDEVSQPDPFALTQVGEQQPADEHELARRNRRYHLTRRTIFDTDRLYLTRVGYRGRREDRLAIADQSEDRHHLGDRLMLGVTGHHHETS